MSIVIWLLTFALVLLSVFLVLIVLMQKSKSDGGVGAALGGGMTEATFGAETGNVLATLTRNGTIAFFVLSFILYLLQIHQHSGERGGVTLPAIPAEAETAPAAETTPAAAAEALPAESAPPSGEAGAVEGAAAVVLPALGAEATPAATEPAK
jgi:preprotein translocase subunit SecG